MPFVVRVLFYASISCNKLPTHFQAKIVDVFGSQFSILGSDFRSCYESGVANILSGPTD